MPPALWVVMGIGWAVNAACAGHMWLRARGGVGQKLVFTLPHAVPILGALVYGGLYRLPKVEPAALESNVPLGAASEDGRFQP